MAEVAAAYHFRRGGGRGEDEVWFVSVEGYWTVRRCDQLGGFIRRRESVESWELTIRTLDSGHDNDLGVYTYRAACSVQYAGWAVVQ